MTSTSANSTSSNPTILGISHQPYRSYLTDRNHFYHSASVANPSQSAQLSSSAAVNSSSSTPYSSHTQQSSGGQQQSSSPIKSTSSGTGQLTTSRTSLNSNSSAHHRSAAMAKTKRSSTTSSTLPIGSDGYTSGKTHETDDEEEYLYSQPSACSRCLFGFFWILAQIGLWGAVILLAFWIFRFEKGFAFQNDAKKMINLHSFLMLSGFIFVNGQSMLIYKTYMCCKKIYNKITHAIFFVLSISLVSFGMLVGIQAQQISSTIDPPVHFYSLHSWIGLVCCGLFALQFFFGFITFLVLLCCERATAGYRARFLPVHVTFGLVIFVLACAACLSGLLQQARIRLGPNDVTKPHYKDIFNNIRDKNPFENSALVINGVGACVIALAVLIPYLVRNFNFNRRYEAASFRVNH